MTPLEKDALLYAKTGKADKLADCLARGVSPNLDELSAIRARVSPGHKSGPGPGRKSGFEQHGK